MVKALISTKAIWLQSLGSQPPHRGADTVVKNPPCLPSDGDDQSVRSFQGPHSLLGKEEAVTPEVTGHLLTPCGSVGMGGGGEGSCLAPGGHLGSSHLGLEATVAPSDTDPRQRGLLEAKMWRVGDLWHHRTSEGRSQVEPGRLLPSLDNLHIQGAEKTLWRGREGSGVWPRYGNNLSVVDRVKKGRCILCVHV